MLEYRVGCNKAADRQAKRIEKIRNVVGLVCVHMLIALAAPAFTQEPKDRAAWTKQIEAVLAAGKDQDALVLIGQAAKALPNDTSFQAPADWFKRLGDKHVKAQAWEVGLTVVDRALKVLPKDEHTSMLIWRSNLFRHWSQALVDKKEIDGSLRVLARAYALDPSDLHIANGIAYHTQESLRAADAKSLEAVIEQYLVLVKQFPKVEEIPQRGRVYTVRAVSKLVAMEKFKEAQAAIDRHAPLLAKPEYRVDLGSLVYDGWAQHLASKKEWQAALDKYVEGMKATPRKDRLLENALATVDAWAEPAIRAKNWDEAIRIYGIGLKYFPDNVHLQGNREICERKKETGK